MKKLLLSLFVIELIASCSRVAVTGRRQMTWFPESSLQTMALTQYQTFLKENKVIASGKDAEMVTRVGQKISKAVNDYMTKKGAGKEIATYKWEYKLVESKDVNAWCMPGGKIVVYSGLLPTTLNEAGLAAVMGHEIAHAIAKHGNERMTQGAIAQGFALTGDVLLSNSPQSRNLFGQSFGIISSVGVLMPFSRKHETEADVLGMRFMAMAGYNPSEAIEVWKRMSKIGGAKPPELLSSHPSNETRIANLTKELKTAMIYYRPN